MVRNFFRFCWFCFWWSSAGKPAKTTARKTLNKSESTRAKNSISLDGEIWPIERDVLFRPGRLKYVRKLIEPQGCVFCTSAEKHATAESLCVYRTKYSQVVVNKFPYNSGHLLVLPLRHCGDLLALSPNEYEDLHLTLRESIEAVKAIFQPTGFNLGLNHGGRVGLEAFRRSDEKTERSQHIEKNVPVLASIRFSTAESPDDSQFLKI